MNPSPFSHIKDRDLQAILQAHPDVYGISTETIQQRVQTQTRSYQEALSQLQGQSYVVDFQQHELRIQQTLEGTPLNTLSLHDNPLPADTPFHRWGEHIITVDAEAPEFLETLYWKPHEIMGLTLFQTPDAPDQGLLFSQRLEALQHLPFSNTLLDPRIYGLKDQSGPYDFFLSPDGPLLFISDRSAGDIYLIDTQNHKMQEVFTLREQVSTYPLMLAPDTNQQKVYYIDSQHTRVGILDYEAGTLEELELASDTYHGKPVNLARYQHLLYVLSAPLRQNDAPSLHVLDTRTWDTVEVLSLPLPLYSQFHDCAANPMNISPDGKHLVILTEKNPHSELLWISTENLEIVAQSIVPGHPFPVQIAFGRPNPIRPYRKNLAQLLVEAGDIKEKTLLHLFPLEEEESAVDLVLPDGDNTEDDTENDTEDNTKNDTEREENEDSAESSDEKSAAVDILASQRQRLIQQKNQSESARVFLSPIEHLQSLPEAQSAEAISLPKSATADILQILTGSFYQHFGIDLEAYPEALKRLREEAETLREQLQTHSLLPVLIENLLPEKTLKTILLRESILTLQAIHDTPDKHLYNTPPTHCPACQSPLLGRWDCETCGMELLSPQRYQARKHMSVRAQTWLPPEYFAISDGQSGRLLLVDTRRYQYVTWQMDFRQLPELKEPWDMLWLENLHFLVTDRGGKQVVECTQGGRIVWSYQPYDEAFTLQKPVYSTLYHTEQEQKRYLIVDQGNHRILEVDSDHKVHWHFGEQPLPQQDLSGKPLAIDKDPRNWPENSLYNPTHVQLTPQRTYLITDTGRDRVIEVQNQQIIQSWGQNLQLQQPVGAQRLLDGKTLIVDAGNQRILELDQEGNIWRETVYHKEGMDPRFYMAQPQKVIRRENQNVVLIDGNRVMEIDPLSKRIVWFSFLHELRLEIELPAHLKPLQVKVPSTAFDSFEVIDPERMTTLRRSLEKIRLFEGASISFFERLEKAMRFKRFDEGSWILQKGHMNKYLFVLQSGKAEVYANADEPPLALSAGDYFGLTSLIYPEPRKSDVKAMSDCGVYMLDKRHFDDIVSHYADILARVKKQAEERLVVVRLRQTPKSTQAQDRLAALLQKQRSAAQERLAVIHPHESQDSAKETAQASQKPTGADANGTETSPETSAEICDVNAQSGHLDHRLNYTEIEQKVMQAAAQEGQNTLEIHIQFKKSARMKLARVSLLVSMMNRWGTLIRTHPAPEKITAGDFDDELIFSLMSDHAKEALYEDLSTLGDISSVYIFDVLVAA
jgi:CRP-like cAMP-binding protein